MKKDLLKAKARQRPSRSGKAGGRYVRDQPA